MLKNYFKIAFRNVARNKVFAIINALGLSIGISACLLIYIVTSFELSYDTFHPDKNRIYRFVTEIQNEASKNNPISTIPDPAAKIIRVSVSGLESVAMFHNYFPKVTISEGGKIIKRFFPSNEPGVPSPIILAEPQYFEIFKYDWLAGNPKTALNEPFRVVISENEAGKYFGNIPLDQIMGRTISYDDSLKVTVSGIVKDWNKNTDFNFRDFISYSTVQNSFLKNQGNWNNWGGWNSATQVFTKLNGKSTPGQINSQVTKIIKAHMTMRPGEQVKILLQPLSDIHFNGDFKDAYSRQAHLPTLYGLMAIAAFILIIAAINFINLSTAQSVERAKEIGIRKVLGSSRINIVFQFLCEIFLLTLFAGLLSVLVMKPLIYLFRDLLPHGIDLGFYNPITILFLLVLILVTSLLAGFYPAKVLSGYLPVISLKGEGSRQVSKGGYLRKSLIVFQFTVSLVFIIATLIIGNQIRFMLNQDMGFTKDAIINIHTEWSYPRSQAKLFADQMKSMADVQMVSLNDGPPAGSGHGGTSISYNKVELFTEALGTDENYVALYQLKLVAGRNIFQSDTIRELVINETCARGLGFKKPEDAIGKLVNFGFSNGPVEVKRPIVGVIADFHSESLHDPIKPVTIANDQSRTIAVRLNSQSKHPKEFQSDIDQISKMWKSTYPNEPFEYKILDDQIAKFYDSYQKTNQIMITAMVIAIFISSMGLFGLAAFTAVQRRKEIGVRKVLGASVSEIVVLLSKDFLKLVILSLILASPIAWYFMSNWLNDFAYRINLSFWIFILAGSMALLIAFITISFQSIKAAIANPVNSLRSE
ncbi:MAG TPA: ABC transporter permease [Puia sp.]|nr:ABC transporter permease [Puia sp.]